MKYARRSFPVLNSVRPAAGLFSLLIVLVALAACSADRWAAVEPGAYIWTRGPRAEAAVLASLQIDRERQTATFSLRDGSEIAVRFAPWERSQWPSGCPANLGSTRMEVLDVTEQPLILGQLVFDDPYLIRDCPPNPVEIVLREGSAFNPSGTACSHLEKCVVFAAVVVESQQAAP